MADAPRYAWGRRDVLRGGAGLLLASSVSGLLTSKAFAAEQVLKIAAPRFNENWSPATGGGDTYYWHSLWLSGPMYFDADGKMQPNVFASWEHSDDLQTWTFKLNPDARFSDGKPITPEDVKGSWELASMPSTKNSRVKTLFGGVAGFDDISLGKAKEMSGVTTGDGTVMVALTKPDPIFFVRLSNLLVPIVRASEARDANGEEVLEWWSPQNGGVSAGPFKMVEYDFDQGHVAFEPNENYWGPKPKLSRIELNIVEDPNVAVQLIKNGEYNAAVELFTTTAVDDLGADFFKGHLIPAGMHFWFNVNNKPLDDVNVRKALIMAVDRAGMCQASIPQGPDLRVEQLLIAVPGDDDPKFEPFPYDPEGAKAALAASSYGGPDNLPKLILGRMRNPVQQAAAQFIVEQWRQNLGITASEIRADMPDESLAHVLRDDAGTRVPDAAAFLMGTIHSSAGAAKGLMGGYKNADVDSKLEAAVVKLVEDPDRTALAQEAQRLFRDDWAFIPWYGQVMPRWATANVAGMDRNLDWNVAAPWDIAIN